MDEVPGITVVRLGHRPGRDERTTTHVALVARAFGADRVVIPEGAGQASETVGDVCERFGGDIEVVTASRPLDHLETATAPIVHLTMYGQPVQSTVEEIAATIDKELIVAVGAGKVPGEVYDLARWNVAVTNQPHSEIAALGVFLDRFTDGAALSTDFEGAAVSVVPSAAGKHLEPTEE